MYRITLNTSKRFMQYTHIKRNLTCYVFKFVQGPLYDSNQQSCGIPQFIKVIFVHLCTSKHEGKSLQVTTVIVTTRLYLFHQSISCGVLKEHLHGLLLWLPSFTTLYFTHSFTQSVISTVPSPLYRIPKSLEL